MPETLATAVENIIGTAIAIAAVMVGRILTKKWEKIERELEGDDDAA